MKKCFFVINFLLFFVISVNAEISSTVLDFSEEGNIVKNYIELLSYTDEEIEKIIGADLTVRGVTKENNGESSLFLSSTARNLHYTGVTKNKVYKIIGQVFAELGEPDKIVLEKGDFSKVVYEKEIRDYEWSIEIWIFYDLDDYEYYISIISNK